MYRNSSLHSTVFKINLEFSRSSILLCVRNYVENCTSPMKVWRNIFLTLGITKQDLNDKTTFRESSTRKIIFTWRWRVCENLVKSLKVSLSIQLQLLTLFNSSEKVKLRNQRVHQKDQCIVCERSEIRIRQVMCSNVHISHCTVELLTEINFIHSLALNQLVIHISLSLKHTSIPCQVSTFDIITNWNCWKKHSKRVFYH